MSIEPMKVYYCYAREDEELRNQLDAHLSPLRRARKLTRWFDKMIQSGANWELEIEKQLRSADIILLLVSSDFIASDYCYNLQLTAALNHYEAGKADIIPILLRPILWEGTPIQRLPLMLPTNRLPVTLWSNHDEAFKNIATGVRDVIQAKLSSKYTTLPSDEIGILEQLGEAVLITRCPQCGMPNRIGAKFCKNDGTELVSTKLLVVPKQIPSSRSKEMWLAEGKDLSAHGRYIDALAAYEQALHLDSQYATAYLFKGDVLYHLQQYAEALTTYEKALRYDPRSAVAYCHSGHALRHLQCYREALASYELALLLAPLQVGAHACNGMGRVFYDLQRYDEALVAYKQATELDPHYAEPYVNKGNVLYDFQRYDEALVAYKQATELDPHYAAPYFFQGNILFYLQHYDEALVAYEQALHVDVHYAAAYYGKGRVYKILGREEEAQAAFRKADSLTSSLR